MGRLRMAGAAATVAMFLCLLGSADAANAATFTVEDGAAVGDGEPGDGVCRSKLRPGTLLRNCTLMAAVEEANALAGSHVILVPAGTYRFEALQLGDAGNMVIRGQITIIGAGPEITQLTASGLLDNGIVVNANARLELRNATYRDSRAIINRGGQLLLANTVIRGNEGLGGGVDHRPIPPFDSTFGGVVTSTTTIRNSRITDNKSILAPLGIIGSNFSGGVSVAGGQMIIESTVIDNNRGRCDNCPGAIVTFHGDAGGESILLMRNVTISGNTAPSGSLGGIFHTNGYLDMNHVTIANNNPGGIDSVDRVTARNSLFVNNAVSNCSSRTGLSNQVAPDGTFIRSTNNLDSGSTCNLAGQQGSISGGNANIGPLQDNGGGTLTHALLAGSQAIDVALCPTGPPPLNRIQFSTDQRGVSRPQDGNNDGVAGCDIGAFERTPPPFSVFIPPLGVPGLSPGSGTIRVNETFTETFHWDVPAPLGWAALGTLDFRLRSNGAIAFWVRWDQVLDTFQLIGASGQPIGFALPPGLNVPLTSNGITLDVAAARAAGSGPEGQRATLVLPLRFDEGTSGRVFSVEVSAQDDLGNQDPFTNAGTITVQGAAISDNDKREREKEKPLTELGRLKKARSNDGGFDDEQTEGNVMATRCDQNEIEIAGMDGITVLKLRGNSRGVCQYVKIGDYVQVDGQKETEELFWVDDLDIDK